MLKEIEKYIRWGVDPLKSSDTVHLASERLSKEDLTDLPVIDEAGTVIGIFGEKEVIKSLFPTYLEELSDTAFVVNDFEDISDHVRSVIDRPVSDFVRKEFVALDEGFSTLHCAELFLHRRQGVIPILRGGQPVGLLRRSDLGRAIFEATAAEPAPK